MTSQTRDQLARDIKEMSKDTKELIKMLRPKGQEIKRKVSLHKRLLKDEIRKLQDVTDLLSDMNDPSIAKDIVRQKQSLASSENELEQTIARVSRMELKVKDAERELETIRQQQQEDKENKKYPKARYVVNLFREVSKISWHPVQQANEVKGFIRGKSAVKTFCFDENKQSRHFITNSLWELGEEETW